MKITKQTWIAIFLIIVWMFLAIFKIIEGNVWASGMLGIGIGMFLSTWEMEKEKQK